MSRDSGEREPLLGNQPRKRAGSNYTGEEGGLSSSALPPSHERETEEEESIMGFTVVVKRAAKKQINACCSKENLKTKLPITKWLPKYRYFEIEIKLLCLNFRFGLVFFIDNWWVFLNIIVIKEFFHKLLIVYKFNILKYYIKLNFEKKPHQTQGINYLESKEKIKKILKKH